MVPKQFNRQAGEAQCFDIINDNFLASNYYYDEQILEN